MVFENLTLFEIQIDGEQIGPRSIGRNAPSEAVDDDESDESASRAKPLFVLALVVAAVAFGWRRYRETDEDVAIESEPEADLATAQ